MTKRRKTILIVLAVAAAVILPCVVGALLIGLGVFAAVTVGMDKVDVTAADRELLVTAADVAPHAGGFIPLAVAEKFTRIEYIDGSSEIDYAYDPGMTAHPFITTTVSHEVTDDDADMVFGIEWNLMKTALSLGPGATFEEDNDFYQAGDMSRFGVLYESDKPIGHLFVAREGNSVYAFSISGAAILDPEVWETLFSDRVESLDEPPPASVE